MPAKKTPAVYMIDGNRTPFLKARGKPGPFSAADLAVAAAQPLLLRQPFAPTAFDEVITGCVMPSQDEANISRIIALRLGCGKQMPAWTVQRNCASGLQAIHSAMRSIQLGRADLILAGGTEAMSHAPLLLNEDMVLWLSRWYAARSFAAKLKTITKLRPQQFVPIIALLRGLRDPVVGLSMGQTAENLAYQFNISRQAMDAFAVQSHHRLAQAYDNQHMQEVTPIFSSNGTCFASDDGMRRDSSIEKLATLSAYFDKKYGAVTAGNSSQITDGAAYLILASETAVEKYALPVLGRLVDVAWAALGPEVMGLGPVHAIAHLLKQQKLKMNDIDYWEINEAFAAQVLACCAAFEDKSYCKEHLGLKQALGTLAQDRLNVDGGAISLGHPVGASGARVTLHMAHVLQRHKAQYGIASLCIGGGQGGAVLIEKEG